MPEVVNPTEDVGALALTVLATGVQIKRGSGVYESIITANDATGTVTIQPGSGAAAVVSVNGPLTINGAPLTALLDASPMTFLTLTQRTGTLNEGIGFRVRQTDPAGNSRGVAGLYVEAANGSGGYYNASLHIYAAGVAGGWAGYANVTNDAGPGLIVRSVDPAGVIRFHIGPDFASVKMLLNGAGQLGIGTTAPTAGYLLDVSGSIRAQGIYLKYLGGVATPIVDTTTGATTDRSFIVFSRGGNAKWWAGLNVESLNTDNYSIYDAANNIGRMRITPLGAITFPVTPVIFGTDPGGTASLRVGGAAFFSDAVTATATTGNTGQALKVIGRSATNDGYIAIYRSDGTTLNGYFGADANSTYISRGLTPVITIANNGVTTIKHTTDGAGTGVMALDTTTGAASDQTYVSFLRGGASKWRVGLNVGGLNADYYDVFSTVAAATYFRVTPNGPRVPNGDFVVGGDPGGAMLLRVQSTFHLGGAGSGNVSMQFAGFDLMGWTGGSVRFGGITSAQWNAVELWANGSKQASIGAGVYILGTDPGGSQTLRVGGPLYAAQLNAGTSNAATYTLDIGAAPADWIGRIANSHATNPFGLWIRYLNAAPNGGGNQFLACSDTVGTKLEVRSNGGIANFSANNVNLSDERVKSMLDVIDCAEAASVFADLGRQNVWQRYQYLDQTHDDTNIGAGAHALHNALPEHLQSSIISKDGWSPRDQSLPEDERLWGIHETDLTYLAYAAISNLAHRVALLESKGAASYTEQAL